MPRPCACCSHSQRHMIEAEHIAGRSSRAIGAAYGIRHDAVHRHMRGHLPASLAAAAGAHLASLDAGAAPQLAPTPEFATGCTATPDEPPTDGPRRALQLDDAPAPAAGQGSPPASAQPAPASSPAPGPPHASTAAPGGPMGLLALAHSLRDRALSILAQAENAGDAKTALAAIREARGVLESLARLEPAGGAGAAVPLAQSPEWHTMRSTLLLALADHPEARLAVAAALIGAGALA